MPGPASRAARTAAAQAARNHGQGTWAAAALAFSTARRAAAGRGPFRGLAGNGKVLAPTPIPVPLAAAPGCLNERFILRDQAGTSCAAGRARRRPARMPLRRLGRLAGAAVGGGIAARTRPPSAHGCPGGRARGRHLPPAPVPRSRRACCRAGAGCELWYGRWDRYEQALRRRAGACGPACASCTSGRRAPPRSPSSPATRWRTRARGRPRRASSCRWPPTRSRSRPPGGAVVAVSLGHLGLAHRLGTPARRSPSAMPEPASSCSSVAWHEDEVRRRRRRRRVPQRCRTSCGSARSDERGGAPHPLRRRRHRAVQRRTRSTTRALPYRILKYARLGRRTVSPPELRVCAPGSAR